MDTRNSAMVAGLYVAGGVIILLVCLSYYGYERQTGNPMLGEALTGESANPSRPSGHARNNPSAPYYHVTLEKANRSLRELQTSLATSRDKLEKQTQSLNQKNAECQALKQELDETLRLLFGLLADETSNSDATRESTKQAKSKLESELSQILESLKQSEALGAEQERQLNRLRSDLKQTAAELVIVQEHSELELAALQAERKDLETVAIEVIARCGVTAVPFLTDRLADDRAEIRRWAVKGLGAIGPDAHEALTAVRQLLSDPDASVREEARLAVAAITEPD